MPLNSSLVFCGLLTMTGRRIQPAAKFIDDLGFFGYTTSRDTGAASLWYSCPMKGLKLPLELPDCAVRAVLQFHSQLLQIRANTIRQGKLTGRLQLAAYLYQ